jgi:hypothetical protein
VVRTRGWSPPHHTHSVLPPSLPHTQAVPSHRVSSEQPSSYVGVAGFAGGWCIPFSCC